MAKLSPMVLPCKCVHAYQDEKYGEGRRLHNPKFDGRYVCTVCLDIKGGVPKKETETQKKKK